MHHVVFNFKRFQAFISTYWHENMSIIHFLFKLHLFTKGSNDKFELAIFYLHKLTGILVPTSNLGNIAKYPRKSLKRCYQDVELYIQASVTRKWLSFFLNIIFLTGSKMMTKGGCEYVSCLAMVCLVHKLLLPSQGCVQTTDMEPKYSWIKQKKI